MSGAAVIEQFGAARAHLDAVCRLLTSPTAEALDSCSALMEAVGELLMDGHARIAEAQRDPAALEAAWSVRRAFLRAVKLLEGAAAFHTGWVAIRGSITGGYTSRGEPAQVLHPGRISIEA
jgi:hypothetical protein